MSNGRFRLTWFGPFVYFITSFESIVITKTNLKNTSKKITQQAKNITRFSKNRSANMTIQKIKRERRVFL